MTKDRKTILFMGDTLVLVLSYVAMVLLRYDTAVTAPQLKIFLFLFCLWLIVFFIFDLYNLRKVNPNPRNIGYLALAVGLAVLLSVLYFYIFPTNGTPKTNLAIVASIAFGLFILWRRSFYLLFSSRYSQRIAVVGSGEAVEHLIHDIGKHPQLGKIVHSQRDAVVKALPDIDVLISYGVHLPILFAASKYKNCEILSLLQAYEELFGKSPLSLVDEEYALGVLTNRKQIGYRIIERIIEILFALLILLVSAPFVLIAMLAIYIEDKGPVIYSQLRVGKNGTPFSIYKLRTMRLDAETHGAQWAAKGDARITSIGRILRKTHLDEVPQMVNIIKGDIALVGPRPERPEFVQELEQSIPYYYLRHVTKPGFTGWAQIKFRYASTLTDSQEKFEYDLYYLKHRNPLLDIGIMLKTVQIIFTH